MTSEVTFTRYSQYALSTQSICRRIVAISLASDSKQIHMTSQTTAERNLFDKQHLGKIDTLLYHVFVFLNHLLMCR